MTHKYRPKKKTRGKRRKYAKRHAEIDEFLRKIEKNPHRRKILSDAMKKEIKGKVR